MLEKLLLNCRSNISEISTFEPKEICNLSKKIYMDSEIINLIEYINNREFDYNQATEWLKDEMIRRINSSNTEKDWMEVVAIKHMLEEIDEIF